jgi:hypothetical protein
MIAARMEAAMRFLKTLGAAGALLLLGTALAGADCICLYKGGSVAHGQTACLITAKGRELARCEKSLNMSTWNFLGEPCPLASAREPRQPALSVKPEPAKS